MNHLIVELANLLNCNETHIRVKNKEVLIQGETNELHLDLLKQTVTTKRPDFKLSKTKDDYKVDNKLLVERLLAKNLNQARPLSYYNGVVTVLTDGLNDVTDKLFDRLETLPILGDFKFKHWLKAPLKVQQVEGKTGLQLIIENQEVMYETKVILVNKTKVSFDFVAYQKLLIDDLFHSLKNWLSDVDLEAIKPELIKLSEDIREEQLKQIDKIETEEGKKLKQQLPLTVIQLNEKRL